VAKFVLAYQGGGMGEDEAAQQAAMEKWMAWFGSLGDAVLDFGNPFGAGKSIGSSGDVSQTTKAELTGYSILEANDLDDALAKAKGCPVLATGGSIDVYEAMPIG